MTAITALLLDADGVVQSPSKGWLAAVTELCGPGFDPEQFIDAVFTAEQPCLRGNGDFATVLARTLEAFDSPRSPAAALEVWTQIDPAPEIFALLPDITIPVCLATNQQSHRAQHMVATLEYAAIFDHLFISCELGCVKPEPAYFRKVMEHLDKTADELLFIDDHQTNVDAARACGLNAERFELADGAERLREILHDYQVIDS